MICCCPKFHCDMSTNNEDTRGWGEVGEASACTKHIHLQKSQIRLSSRNVWVYFHGSTTFDERSVKIRNTLKRPNAKSSIDI